MIELQDIYYVHYILSVNSQWERLLYCSGLAEIHAKTAVSVILEQHHSMAVTPPAATMIIEMTCANKDPKKARIRTWDFHIRPSEPRTNVPVLSAIVISLPQLISDFPVY